MSDHPVSVGVFLTNQHKPGTDLPSALEGQYEMVRFARDHGWDSVWAGQHYLPETMSMPQPVPFLARLAAEAGDMRIGIGILLLALHNPLQIAETYASLDAITGGRLIFGVGLGYRDIEYDAFGIERSDRVKRFEANLDVVERLWTEDSVTVDLPWCRLNEAKLLVKPTQQPRPPIWMAANADAAVRRAARRSDAWLVNPHATHETVERQIELFNATRSEAGLVPPAESPAIREVFCASTREKALELVRPYLEAKYAAYADWGQDKALPGDESFRIEFEELASGRFVIGTPDDCLEQLTRWRDHHGINHFVLRTEWVGMPTEIALGSMQLLTDEVIPVLRDGP